METIHDTFRRQGLVRPSEGRVLGGVCAGLGRKLGLEPWPARLLFMLVLFIIPGSQLLVYPLLWILMPEDKTWAPIPPATNSTYPTVNAETKQPAGAGR